MNSATVWQGVRCTTRLNPLYTRVVIVERSLSDEKIARSVNYLSKSTHQSPRSLSDLSMTVQWSPWSPQSFDSVQHNLLMITKGSNLSTNQATNTMTWYSPQSHYPDIEKTSACLILIISSTWLGSDKYQFDKSLVWLDQGSNPRSPTREACALPIRSLCLVTKHRRDWRLRLTRFKTF